MSFEHSTQVIAELAATSAPSEETSEATTRVRIIDTVLFDALGWRRTDCDAERPSQGSTKGFLDYLMRQDRHHLLVVEAKREGKTFSVPKERTNRQYSVGTLLNFCGPHLEEVVYQAQKYGADTGTPFACVTNGHQWAIFRSFIPDSGWKNGQAQVFHSLDDIRANWSDFFECLNPARMAAGSLDVLLPPTRSKPPRFAKTYNDERGHDGNKPDHEYAPAFRLIHKQAFDTLIDATNEKALARCYVATTSSETYDRDLAALLVPARTPAASGATQPVHRDAKPNQTFIESLHGPEAEPAVLVIVGSIGSGKTTFIHHFLKVWN